MRHVNSTTQHFGSLQQWALGTAAVTCSSAPAASIELLIHLTHTSPPSSWFSGHIPFLPQQLAAENFTKSSSWHETTHSFQLLAWQAKCPISPVWHQLVALTPNLLSSWHSGHEITGPTETIWRAIFWQFFRDLYTLNITLIIFNTQYTQIYLQS